MESQPRDLNNLTVSIRKLEAYRDEFNRSWYETHKDSPGELKYAGQETVASTLLDVTNPIFNWPADADLSRITADDPTRFKYDYFLKLRALNDDGRGYAQYGMDIWFNTNSGRTEGYRWRSIEADRPEFESVSEDEVWQYTDYSVKNILDHEEYVRKIHNLPLVQFGKTAIGKKPESAELSEHRVSMSGNNLLINDRVLDASDDAQILHSALVLGKDDIIHGLEEFRERQEKLNPEAEVSLAPFKVVDLPAGNKRTLKKSLTKEAIESKEQVFYDKRVLKPKLQPYWNAVANSRFTPHVRLYGTRSGWELGLWAAVVGNETIPPVSG